MQNDFGIFGIVHAAFAKAQDVVFVPGVGIIDTVLIDPDILRLHIDRAQRRAKSQALDVELRFGHPVIRHDLLKAVIVPGVDEGIIFGECRIPCFTADVGVIPTQIAAAIQVRQGDDMVGWLQGRVISIFLIGQGLVLQICNRIGKENLPRSGGDPGTGFLVQRRAAHQDKQNGDDQAGS